jgi:hypothetical protein
MSKKGLFGLMVIFIGFMLVFAFIGCDSGGGGSGSSSGNIIGTWHGNVMGFDFTAVFTASAWVATASAGGGDSGTYTFDGSNGRLISTSIGAPIEIGTFTLLDSNTMRMTFNQNSVVPPGYYTFVRVQ